ncbi:MAG: DUF1559 domain-containing protein [Planctomycetota bacterium]|nr:DUF1559 domain-containing protein [Planctomycetota bacterium]
MTRNTILKTRQIAAHGPTGFTLVELLVVIGIIGMLVALLLPAVMSGQEQARQTQCAKQMKDLASANLAHAMKKGRFPGWQEKNSAGQYDTWIVKILPYLDMQQEFRNATLREHDPMFYCPSNPPESTEPTNLALGYRGNVGSGSDGVFRDRGNGTQVVGLEDIRDGKKNTMLLSESAQHLAEDGPGWNTDASTRQPNDLGFSYNANNTEGAQALNNVTSSTGAASSFHQEGFNVAYCDGHVDFFYFPPISQDANSLTTEETNLYQAYQAKMTVAEND